VAQSHGCADRLLAGLGRTMISAIGQVVAEAVQRGAITPSGTYFMKPLVSAIIAAMNATQS
jgi:hypothetical protein